MFVFLFFSQHGKQPNTTGVSVENPYLKAQNATYRAIHIVDGYCLQTHLEAI